MVGRATRSAGPSGGRTSSGGLGGYEDKGRRRELVDGVESVSDHNWFGVNVGVGIRRGLAESRFSLLAESRLHIRMQRVYPDYDVGRLELVTVMVGGVLSWQGAIRFSRP